MCIALGLLLKVSRLFTHYSKCPHLVQKPILSGNLMFYQKMLKLQSLPYYIKNGIWIFAKICSHRDFDIPCQNMLTLSFFTRLAKICSHRDFNITFKNILTLKINNLPENAHIGIWTHNFFCQKVLTLGWVWHENHLKITY